MSLVLENPWERTQDIWCASGKAASSACAGKRATRGFTSRALDSRFECLAFFQRIFKQKRDCSSLEKCLARPVSYRDFWQTALGLKRGTLVWNKDGMNRTGGQIPPKIRRGIYPPPLNWSEHTVSNAGTTQWTSNSTHKFIYKYIVHIYNFISSIKSSSEWCDRKSPPACILLSLWRFEQNYRLVLSPIEENN